MIDKFEKDFFEGAQVEHIQLDLLNDQWIALLTEFAENEWSVEEGMHYILAAGLHAIQNENVLREIESGGLDPLSELNKLQLERARLESRYAVMKYRTYQLLQAVKVLEWKLNAAMTQLEGLIEANRRLREQLKQKS